MKNLLRFIRFLLLFARLFADDDGSLNPVQEQEAAAPETYVVGDLGSVIQLAVKSSVGEALQEQKKTNEGLQVELRDLRSEIREKDALVEALSEKVSAQDETLRDLKAEVREKNTVVQALSDWTKNAHGGGANCKCDVSIKMFDDVEGRVEGLEITQQTTSEAIRRSQVRLDLAERTNVILGARMDQSKMEHDNLYEKFESLHRRVNGAIDDHHEEAQRRQNLHIETKEMNSAVHKMLKQLSPYIPKSTGSVGGRSGAFRRNAGPPPSPEEERPSVFDNKERRELAAISRAAGVSMYVPEDTNELNIGGGCTVEENLIVQGDATFKGNLEIKGDLTVRGKIYAASSVDYSPPTPVPMHVPTTPVPTVSQNPTEAPTARPSKAPTGGRRRCPLFP